MKQCQKVVTTAQMRALEAAAVAAGATWAGLMEQAGLGVAGEALQVLDLLPGREVLVLIGPGNNGGDGLVVARHLHDAGVPVTLYLWRRSALGDLNWQLCRDRSIPEHTASDDPSRSILRQLLAGSNLVVDALLGAGANRLVTGELAEIVAAVNSVGVGTAVAQEREHSKRLSQPSGRPSVLAVDLPTGIHSDSGQVLGDAICATVTVATGLLKRGLIMNPGRAYAGELRTVSIGLVPKDVEALMSELITAKYARTLLPARPADSHKGTFGKALVVAGSPQYPGAAALATAGAARAGAGVVSLATGRSAAGGSGRLPEVILNLLPEAEWGALGESAADELLKNIGDYQALLVGPGIGREKPTRRFLERLLGLDTVRHRTQIGFRIGSSSEKPTESSRPELPPTVLDADALTLLSQLGGDGSSHTTGDAPARLGDFFQPAAAETHEEVVAWWERLPRMHCILTPHPGEMRRLLGVETLNDDRVKVAEEAAARWGQVVVLKGANTVVAHPEGHSLINEGGNPALATAGTGDVLAGTIVGLLAQGVDLFDAAALGVYLHSAAGRLVRDELGDMGALASDLLPRLPLAIKALRAEPG